MKLEYDEALPSLAFNVSLRRCIQGVGVPPPPQQKATAQQPTLAAAQPAAPAPRAAAAAASTPYRPSSSSSSSTASMTGATPTQRLPPQQQQHDRAPPPPAATAAPAASAAAAYSMAAADDATVAVPNMSASGRGPARYCPPSSTCISKPHSLRFTASYDTASNICRVLAFGPTGYAAAGPMGTDETVKVPAISANSVAGGIAAARSRLAQLGGGARRVTRAAEVRPVKQGGIYFIKIWGIQIGASGWL